MTSNRVLFLVVGAAALVGAALAAPACGGDDDPLAERCSQVCQIAATDPCGKGDFKAKCVADCRALAGEAAAKGFKGNDCGSCIAGLFKYSGKRCSNNQVCTYFGEQQTCEGTSCSAEAEVCFGAKGPTGMDDPACTDLCIETD